MASRGQARLQREPLPRATCAAVGGPPAASEKPCRGLQHHFFVLRAAKIEHRPRNCRSSGRTVVNNAIGDELGASVLIFARDRIYLVTWNTAKVERSMLGPRKTHFADGWAGKAEAAGCKATQSGAPWLPSCLAFGATSPCSCVLALRRSLHFSLVRHHLLSCFFWVGVGASSARGGAS